MCGENMRVIVITGMLIILFCDCINGQSMPKNQYRAAACSGELPVLMWDKTKWPPNYSVRCYQDFTYAITDPQYNYIQNYPETVPTPLVGYWPLRMVVDVQSLQTLKALQYPVTPCNSFLVNDAVNMISNAVQEWNSVCGSYPEVKIVDKLSSQWEGLIAASANKMLFGSNLYEWRTTNAARSVLRATGNVNGQNIVMYTKIHLGNNPYILLNMCVEFMQVTMWSTDCPCNSSCLAGNRVCADYEHIIKHEIGHLYFLKHYEDCSANAGYDTYGIMAAESHPANPNRPDLISICDNDLRLEDVCFLCRMHCVPSCGGTTNAESGYLGISSLNATLYPNPASERIIVNGGKEHYSYKVISTSGVVLQEADEVTGPAEINLLDVPTGVYFVFIYNDLSSVVKSIVVQ